MVSNTTGCRCHLRTSRLWLCSLVACALLFKSTSGAEDVPRRDRPTERTTLAKDSLWPFVGRGEIAGDLWATADVKPPPPAQSAPASQCVLTWLRWHGGKVDQVSDILLAKGATLLCALAGERYILQSENRRTPNAPLVYEIALKDRKGIVLSRWSSTGAHWRTFPSANGKYAAVLSVSESDVTRDASKLRDLKCRIGLIDAGDRSMTWVTESQPESLEGQFQFQGYADSAMALPTSDGKHIAIVPFEHDGKTDRVAVVDVTTHKLLWGRSSDEVVSGHALRFNIDNSVLFVGTYGPHVVSFDSQSGKILGSWAATADGEHKSGYGLPYVSSIAVSPDGEYVAAVIEGVTGGDVYVRSLRNKTTVRLIHGSKGVANAVAFSPDSKCLATMDSDSICIWSKQEWK